MNCYVQTNTYSHANKSVQTPSFEEFNDVQRNNSSSVKSSISLTPIATFAPYDRTQEDKSTRTGKVNRPPPSSKNAPLTYDELD
jgi:hypothetical protein